MAYAPDIETRIEAQFKDTQRVRGLLAALAPSKEEARILRCILALSDTDYDSVAAWVKKANADPRDLFWYAEYDNREVRKYDFARPFDEQVPYSQSE